MAWHASSALRYELSGSWVRRVKQEHRERRAGADHDASSGPTLSVLPKIFAPKSGLAMLCCALPALKLRFKKSFDRG
jgi:hypothetical protein